MAKDLKINRVWYHAGSKAHYDIPVKRVKEISELCTVVPNRTIVKIIKGEITSYEQI